VKKKLDFFEIIVGIYVPTIVLIIILSLVHKLGEYPLPKSESLKKILIEFGLYFLILILYLIFIIFFLDPFGNFLYITVVFSTIIYLLIPFIYTHYRDHWTSKDLGINSKIESKWIAIIITFSFLMLL
jgi:hypothetical protein